MVRLVAREAISALELLGLSNYEAKVYLALLRLGEATAQEISKESGIPYSRIHGVLNSLADKGLIEVILLRPKKYRLINPQLALNILADKLKRKIDTSKEIILSIAQQCREAPKITDIEFGVIQDKDVLEALAVSLIKTASKELLLSVPIDFALRIGHILEELREKKIHIALNLYNVTRGEDLEKLQMVADEIRFRESPNAFIIVKDFEEAVYSPKIRVGAKRPFTSLHIIGDDLIYIFSSFYYHHIWAFSKTYKAIEHEFNKEWIRTYVHIWTLLDALEKLKKKKYKVKLRIKGYWVKTGEPVSIEGEVVRVIRFLEKGLHSVEVNVEGKVYSIGGYRASIEDIEGREFIVKAFMEE